jgi:hypothetical protein
VAFPAEVGLRTMPSGKKSFENMSDRKEPLKMTDGNLDIFVKNNPSQKPGKAFSFRP